LAEHLGGRAARLLQVITQAGIGFRLARTWPQVTRARERQLKNEGGASRYCPICQADRKARGLPRRPHRGDRTIQRTSRTNGGGRPRQPWAVAVPTRGARPDRVAAFLELNPKFARPAGASAAKQWGRARGREEIELLTPRVTTAAFEENQQLSQQRVATITRRAVRARLRARQQRAAERVEQGRTGAVAARTHQRLAAHKDRPQRRPAGDRRPHRVREERDRER
jgi:hypothetical protein